LIVRIIAYALKGGNSSVGLLAGDADPSGVALLKDINGCVATLGFDSPVSKLQASVASTV